MFKRISEIIGCYANPPATDKDIKALTTAFFPFQINTELESFLGVMNGQKDEGFLSCEEIIEERDFYRKIFKEEGERFPEALLPIYSFDIRTLFIVLSKCKSEQSGVFGFYISDGDTDFYLEYNSLQSMVKTFIELDSFSKINKYSDTQGHYIDRNIYDQIELKLNPDIYQLKQKGSFSKLGVKNIYDFYNLPTEWFS